MAVPPATWANSTDAPPMIRSAMRLRASSPADVRATLNLTVGPVPSSLTSNARPIGTRTAFGLPSEPTPIFI